MLPSNSSRSLVTAFRSPATAASSRRLPFRGQRSRPATSPPPTRFHRPFGSLAPQPIFPEGATSGHGCFVASNPLRLSPHGSANRYLRSPLPLRSFASLGIKAFNRSRCLPARLTIPPDCLSLPAAVSISSVGCGSTFLARFDSAEIGRAHV